MFAAVCRCRGSCAPEWNIFLGIYCLPTVVAKIRTLAIKRKVSALRAVTHFVRYKGEGLVIRDPLKTIVAGAAEVSGHQ